MVSCHACGEAVEARERVAFRAVCDSCGADLYVCLNWAGTGEDAARAKLEALFRKPGAPASGPAGKKDPKAALDALFKKKKP
jgi:hypothetical protein